MIFMSLRAKIYLSTKTLEAVQKWYKKTGVIYEFFDSRDEVYPYILVNAKEKVNRPHRPIGENKFIPLVILIGRLVSL